MTVASNKSAAARLDAVEQSRTLSAEEERKLLERVHKLLNMKGRTPEETASYAAKAQDLVTAYNLDMARAGDVADGGGRRAEEKLRGGFYEFERDLWSRVADLNFCLYWSGWVEVERERQDVRTAEYSWYRQKYRRERQHRIVGRTINIAATQNMMSYLMGAIERLTREWLGDNMTTGLRSRRATSFREGVAAEIASRLWDRRAAQMAEEARVAEEERRRHEAAGMAGASSSTALTISSVRQSERDANYDTIYGEGWSARRAARLAAQAAAEREAQEAYTRWAAENPEEAAREEAKARKKERARRPSYGRAEKERDWGAFNAGHERGSQISLDQQVSRRDSGALPAPRS